VPGAVDVCEDSEALKEEGVGEFRRVRRG
jgi:hypothetical protein